MSKRALITGGNGYIGHQLQKELKKNNYRLDLQIQVSPHLGINLMSVNLESKEQ